MIAVNSQNDHFGGLDVAIGLRGALRQCGGIDAPDAKFGGELASQFAHEVPKCRHRAADGCDAVVKDDDLEFFGGFYGQHRMRF
jgi:hypothetical protein